MLKYLNKYKIDGKLYTIDTSFKTALSCFEIVNSNDINDTERAFAVIFKLFGFIPRENLDLFYKAAIHYLQRGETLEEQRMHKKDIDLVLDMKYIVPSFLYDYNVDLSQTDMHFYEFLDLLSGISDKSTISRVRYIRNYNVHDIKDPKAKADMIEAQESVALPIERSKEEQEKIDEFNSLFE